MWIFGFISIVILIAIFLDIINIKPKDVNDDLWTKVKLNINSKIGIGWCRVIPGKEVRFYKTDGSLIDLKKNKVQIIEKCIESSVNHPIPLDK